VGKTLLGSLANAAARRTAEMPIPYTGRSASKTSFFGRLTGAEAQLRAMSSVGTLFAIVDRTSNATALVEWKLWRKAKSGRDEDRVEVTAHAALDLWNKPNPFMPRQEYVETSTQHYDLTGETWWVIARASGYTIPLEMWPVRPDRMTPVPDRERFLAGYIYTSPDGEQVPLGLDEVIQIRRPNPMDPYRGLSPVLSILPDLDTARYSAEWARAFFINSAQPGGIIELPSSLDDNEFNQLRERWNEQHRGVGNAHRVAILEMGKWVDRTISQRDMQFVELRGVTRDAIREAYGISKSALGDFEDVNRAASLTAKAWFAEQITIPRLERIKAALNHDLLPMFGPTTQGLEFDYCNPVPADPEVESTQLTARANAAAALRTAGWEPAGVLSAVGLPEIPFSGPAAAPALPSAPLPKALAAPAAAYTVERLALPAAPVDTAWDAMVAGLLPTFTAAVDADLTAVQSLHTFALDTLVARWGEDVLPGQYQALREQIAAAVDGNDLAALSTLTLPTDAAVTVLRTALADTADSAAEQVAGQARAQGVDVTAPKVDESVRNSASRLLVVDFGAELSEIAAATAGLLAGDVVTSAVAEAIRLFAPGVDGASIAGQVVEFVRGLKGAFRRSRLGGALHRAVNVGRLATIAEAPKAVLTASEKLDTNTCQPCQDIDGTEFDDVAAAWAAYGAGPYWACEGRDRCRGTVTARWES
jgi:HK97 family phage portal protein